MENGLKMANLLSKTVGTFKDGLRI